MQSHVLVKCGFAGCQIEVSSSNMARHRKRCHDSSQRSNKAQDYISCGICSLSLSRKRAAQHERKVHYQVWEERNRLKIGKKDISQTMKRLKPQTSNSSSLQMRGGRKEQKREMTNIDSICPQSKKEDQHDVQFQPTTKLFAPSCHNGGALDRLGQLWSGRQKLVLSYYSYLSPARNVYFRIKPGCGMTYFIRHIKEKYQGDYQVIVVNNHFKSAQTLEQKLFEAMDFTCIVVVDLQLPYRILKAVTGRKQTYVFVSSDQLQGWFAKRLISNISTVTINHFIVYEILRSRLKILDEIANRGKETYKIFQSQVHMRLQQGWSVNQVLNHVCVAIVVNFDIQNWGQMSIMDDKQTVTLEPMSLGFGMAENDIEQLSLVMRGDQPLADREGKLKCAFRNALHAKWIDESQKVLIPSIIYRDFLIKYGSRHLLAQWDKING